MKKALHETIHLQRGQCEMNTVDLRKGTLQNFTKEGQDSREYRVTIGYLQLKLSLVKNDDH